MALDERGPTRGGRFQIARNRISRILSTYTIANARTLEQKISDAGPGHMRVDPHILTRARNSLTKSGELETIRHGRLPWYHLTGADAELVKARLSTLSAVHEQTNRQQFAMLVGQALEIAVFRALGSQKALTYFGDFPDLDAHDDGVLYSKTEPPGSLSGKRLPNGKSLDFLVNDGSVYGGIEVKNIREWMYPNREEIRELLLKCCVLDVVPVLIARRIQFSTFSVLHRCGAILHQTYNQFYPDSARDLSEQVKAKDLLGYHDVRLGNQPDDRLLKFVQVNLPLLLPAAREKFERFKDLLASYGNGELDYKEFAGRVKRRVAGQPEDEPAGEEEVGEDVDFGDLFE